MRIKKEDYDEMVEKLKKLTGEVDNLKRENCILEYKIKALNENKKLYKIIYQTSWYYEAYSIGEPTFKDGIYSFKDAETEAIQNLHATTTFSYKEI